MYVWKKVYLIWLFYIENSVYNLVKICNVYRGWKNECLVYGMNETWPIHIITSIIVKTTTKTKTKNQDAHSVSVSTPMRGILMWSGSQQRELIQDFCLTRKQEMSQMWYFLFHSLERIRWDSRARTNSGGQFKYFPAVSLSESFGRAPEFDIYLLPLSKILVLFSLHWKHLWSENSSGV